MRNDSNAEAPRKRFKPRRDVKATTLPTPSQERVLGPDLPPLRAFYALIVGPGKRGPVVRRVYIEFELIPA